jgi:signal transduction histidine kinase
VRFELELAEGAHVAGDGARLSHALSTLARFGLPTCRSVIHAHDGEIGVESSPGAGTTFTLSLPLYGEGHNDPLAHATHSP